MGDLPAAYDPVHIRRELAELSREPFIEAEARLLEAMPSVEDIRAFASKYPDRWAQAVAIMLKPVGYREKVDVELGDSIVALAMRLRGKSDSEYQAIAREHGIALDGGVSLSPASPPPKALASGSPPPGPRLT